MDHPLCLLRWQKPDYQIYKRNEPESDLTVSDLPHFPCLLTLTSSCQTSGLKREEKCTLKRLYGVLSYDLPLDLNFIVNNSNHIMKAKLSLASRAASGYWGTTEVCIQLTTEGAVVPIVICRSLISPHMACRSKL